MDRNVLAVFEDLCGGLPIDLRLTKAIHQFRTAFVNKNEDHVIFFGGNLTGVQVVRFTSAETNAWFTDIVEVDDFKLEERLHALPLINSEWNVSSDVFNLSCAWLCHALYNSKKLSEGQRHEAMVETLIILQYKFLTSRLFRHFQYPADKSIAEATYASLSYKFDLKRHGSWGALLRARAEDICSAQSIHLKALRYMDDDESVIYLLNDTQGRIRDMLKNIYDVFLKVHHEGRAISSETSMVEHDGSAMLKDQTNGLLTYGRYISSIITDKNSFVKEELCRIIEKMIPAMPPKLFKQTLEWMSDNYRTNASEGIADVLQKTLVHSFDYLSEHRSLMKNTTDIAGLLSRLRGVYMSSRSTDKVLMELRTKTEEIVRLATHNKNKSVISATRTGVLLYCVARAITMHHYTSAKV